MDKTPMMVRIEKDPTLKTLLDNTTKSIGFYVKKEPGLNMPGGVTTTDVVVTYIGILRSFNAYFAKQTGAILYSEEDILEAAKRYSSKFDSSVLTATR